MAVEHLVFLLQALQALEGVLLMCRVNDFVRTDSDAVDIEYWKGMNIGRKDRSAGSKKVTHLACACDRKGKDKRIPSIRPSSDLHFRTQRYLS